VRGFTIGEGVGADKMRYRSPTAGSSFGTFRTFADDGTAGMATTQWARHSDR